MDKKESNIKKTIKKNYVGCIDRIGVLLCIPIALWGFFFTKAEYTYRNAIGIDNSEEIKKEAEKMLDQKDCKMTWWWQWEIIGDKKGIIESGRDALQAHAKKCPLFSLQLKKALEFGADPNGDWVHKETFGIKRKDIFDAVYPDCIIPGITKRIIAGVLGSIVVYLSSLSLLMSLSRLIRFSLKGSKKCYLWIQKGLSS